MRTIPALIAATALVISLAACSGPGSDLASCSPAIAAGELSDAITVTGSQQPDVAFPTPLVASEIERSFVELGDGAVAQPGSYALVHYAQFDGSNEELIGSTWANQGDAVIAPVGEEGGVLGEVIACAPVGSRVSATIPVELFNAEAEPGATLVVVLDVIDSMLGKADGADQLPQSGFPTLALAPSGQPGISIPKQDPPADLRIMTTKKGDGAVVAEGDEAYVHYTGMLWSGSSIFDSSWDRGTPGVILAQEGSATTPGVIPGFAEALIGATVGSQVLAVIPPDEGYGNAAAEGIPAGSTLVFVIDVLGIKN